jgi:hypothetical protein
MLLLFSCGNIEEILCRILHQYLGLIVCLVAALHRRFPTIRMEPLNVGDPAKQAIARRRVGRKQQPVNAIWVWSFEMLGVLSIPHDRATVQSFPSGSPERIATRSPSFP